MVNRWSLMSYVANRYGKVQPVFEEAAEKLRRVRAKEMDITELEDDPERVELRFAREEGERQAVMERINGGVDFQDSFILDVLSGLSRSVCRITQHGRAVGTGFLISDRVIMTNNHVIQSPSEAQGMVAEFNFELDRDRKYKKSLCFEIVPQDFFLTSSYATDPAVPHSGLDFTMVAVATSSQDQVAISTITPIYLDGVKGKIIKGENCVIIQHPQGMPKKVVLKNTAFFSETRTRIVYESDTLPGSSGSMVVALGTGEIIALHHAGLPRTDSQNRILTRDGNLAGPSTPDDQIDWLGNEGIKISRIVDALKDASLPPQMEFVRKKLLHKTMEIKKEIDDTGISESAQFHPAPLPDQTDSPTNSSTISPLTMNPSPASRQDFIFTAKNDPEVLSEIRAILRVRYGEDPHIRLSLPAFAAPGAMEMFALNVPAKGNPEEEARSLSTIPGIINVETDIPLRLNSSPEKKAMYAQTPAHESIVEEGFAEPNEPDFLRMYQKKNKSEYVFDKQAHEYRKWNWYATSFDKVLADEETVSPVEKGIKIVQFDTGFTHHGKVEGAFDVESDYDFVDGDETAEDSFTSGILKHPGHATRTGSLLVGNEMTLLDGDGNAGLLSKFGFKLIPYRICKSVILIRRQQELADALNLCLAQRYPIITMSLGLPPTLATAVMAKKAYDAGIIWCCAAGNIVQVVVAPAVYPGTLAVAASNPLDKEWSLSSRGDSVDITAPGEDVYVPIFLKPKGNEAPGQAFSYGDGTSYATPHVAAAAALWLAKYDDELNTGAYAGWRKVEAFRKALAVSARRKNNLPQKEFGHGMLDVEKLLQTPPEKPAKLTYAYEGMDEGRLGEVTQAYGEMAKTLWNRLHGWVIGTRRGGQESFAPAASGLSDYSKMLEQNLFPGQSSSLESTGALSEAELLSRFATVHQKIESLLKK